MFNLTPAAKNILIINGIIFVLTSGYIIEEFGLRYILSSEFKPYQFLTYMWIHAGFGHILSNMWFLYIFGDNVESILGHVKFLLFYFLCGFGAAFAQYITDPNSSIPMVGASGAIAGVLGAYMISFPRAKVHVFAFIIIFITTLVVPAQLVLGLWFLVQLTNGLNSLGIDTNGGVAWFAHIGGFIVGIGTIKYIQNYKLSNS